MLRYGHGMATEDRQSFTKAGNARLLWWVEVLCVSCQFQPSRNRRLRTALCAGAVGGTMIDPIRGPKGLVESLDYSTLAKHWVIAEAPRK